MRKFECGWCGEKYTHSKDHICPKIFIHQSEFSEPIQQIEIRGDDLSFRWNKKGEIIIFPKSASQSKPRSKK